MDFFGALIVLAISLVIIYLSLTYYKEKTKSDLTEAVTIIISAAGIVSSLQLGWISIFEVEAFIGKLQDQRIQVLVGAFAILWVSTQAIVQIYSKHYRCDPTVLVKQQQL
ncbi:hypothetical protein BJK05_06215 [Pectobacterium polaris]|uniref:hypothetical protein n=1 Tax=Pectobacterium polaris TaxID=2042057 RepID=UPI000BAC6B14|nr:hypothetical protein [Pectobacterium polaris]ASY79612.1 hypothetical protein BJK05_06215 [Pectobacterium polaris]MBN3215442.1 hypothetical protein [Pectobacterium polaris]RUR99501.1 hypothetical protein KHDHEBDM_01784 [Pectobacterium polaris]